MSEYIGIGPVLRGAIVLIENGGLLLERMVYRGTHYVVLPGGQQEVGETIEACAIRETWEETGLRVELDKLLYVSERVPTQCPGFHLVNISFLAHRVGGSLNQEPVIESDVKTITDIFFAPLTDVPKLFPTLGTQIVKDAGRSFARREPKLQTTFGDAP